MQFELFISFGCSNQPPPNPLNPPLTQQILNTLFHFLAPTAAHILRLQKLHHDSGSPNFSDTVSSCVQNHSALLCVVLFVIIKPPYILLIFLCPPASAGFLLPVCPGCQASVRFVCRGKMAVPQQPTTKPCCHPLLPLLPR